jgi:hypothetical protein
MKIIVQVLVFSTMFISPVLGQKPIPSKTFSPPNFTIDRNHVNIVLRNIKVTIIADIGAVSWSLSADQNNRTHATGYVPKNPTIHIDLLDRDGGVIPGDRITLAPSHVRCGEAPNQVWEGRVSDYPIEGSLLDTIVDIRLSSEDITYDVASC